MKITKTDWEEEGAKWRVRSENSIYLNKKEKIHSISSYQEENYHRYLLALTVNAKSSFRRKFICLTLHYLWDRRTMFWSYMGAMLQSAHCCRYKVAVYKHPLQDRVQPGVHRHLRTNTGNLSTILQKLRIVLISTTSQRHSKFLY